MIEVDLHAGGEAHDYLQEAINQLLEQMEAFKATEVNVDIYSDYSGCVMDKYHDMHLQWSKEFIYTLKQLHVLKLDYGKYLEDMGAFDSNVFSEAGVAEVDDGSASPTPVRDLKYTVVDGDTLSGIARDHGVDLQDLIDHNKQIADPDIIHVGDIIVIPSAITGATIGGAVGGSVGVGSNETSTPSGTVSLYEEDLMIGPKPGINQDLEMNTVILNDSHYNHHTENVSSITTVDEKGFAWDVNYFNKKYNENIETYEAIAEEVGLPKELVAALHYRESGCDFDSYMHNGDPLGQVTTHVPKGIYFETFEESAIDALTGFEEYRDRYGLSADSSDLSSMMSFGERYNGMGYFNKGRTNPYLYSGTDAYTTGKYVADGVYDGNFKDKQPGIYLLINSVMN